MKSNVAYNIWGSGNFWDLVKIIMNSQERTYTCIHIIFNIILRGLPKAVYESISFAQETLLTPQDKTFLT